METNQKKSTHGCYNRPAQFKSAFRVNDGTILEINHHGTRVVQDYKMQEFRMSHDCRYDKRATDTRCEGCQRVSDVMPD